MTTPRRPAQPLAWIAVAGVILLAGALGIVFLSPRPEAPASPVAAARSTPPQGGANVTVDGERVRVPLADLVPSRLPAEGVPRGWHLKEFAGQAAVDLVARMVMPELREWIRRRFVNLDNPYALVETFDIARLRSLFTQ